MPPLYTRTVADDKQSLLCAHICTAEVHPAFIIEAEGTHIAITIQHVLILLLSPLKPANDNSHRGACTLV